MKLYLGGIKQMENQKTDVETLPWNRSCCGTGNLFSDWF